MNLRSRFFWNAFEKKPVIGIMRNLSQERIDKIVPLCQKAGLTTLEITMNSEGAQQIILKLCLQYPDLNIGAGTVLDMTDVKLALKAGASFIVTPVLNEEVISYCAKNEIPIFPGALTPTEIYKAWKLGASAVKVFPASLFGPAYLKELRGPLGKIPLLPTGGVSLENIEDYFEAGAIGVGMGSTLFNKTLIAKGDFKGLYLHLENVASGVGRCSNQFKIKV